VPDLVDPSGIDQRSVTEDDRLTILVFMDPHLGQYGTLNTFNQQETAAFFDSQTGFLGAAFFLATGTDRIAEFIQWEKLRAFAPVAQYPRFHQHNDFIEQHCHAVDAGPHHVLHSICSSPPTVPSPT